MPNFWSLQRRRGTTSTAGSAALEIAEELHPIQLYTAGGLVNAQVVPNGERMLDILNGHIELRLKDLEFTPYHTDHLPSSTPDWMTVACDTILLAAPPAHVSPRQLRIHRRQRRVELQVPPFTVIGNAHMAPGYALNDFLRRQTQPFIPITVALLRHDDNASFDRSVPVALVNRGRVTGIRDLLA